MPYRVNEPHLDYNTVATSVTINLFSSDWVSIKNFLGKLFLSVVTTSLQVHICLFSKKQILNSYLWILTASLMRDDPSSIRANNVSCSSRPTDSFSFNVARIENSSGKYSQYLDKNGPILNRLHRIISKIACAPLEWLCIVSILILVKSFSCSKIDQLRSKTPRMHAAGTSINFAFREEISKYLHSFYNGGLGENIWKHK